MAMSTTTTVTDIKNGWTRDLKLARRLSANIPSTTLPISCVNSARLSSQLPGQPRPVIWQSGTNTMISSTIDVVPAEPLSSPSSPSVVTTSFVRQRSNRRQKVLPPLPEGEHNVAARSRIRNRTEQRRSRLSQRSTGRAPMRITRSTKHRNSPKLNKRCSLPLPLHLASSSIKPYDNNLSKQKKKNRQSLPLTLHPPPFLASLNSPLFQDPWLEDYHRQIISIHERRCSRIFSSLLLVSPKTRFSKPISIIVPSKSEPTITQNTATVAHRKRRDISNVPASAAFFLRHLDHFGHAPYIISQLQVVRRPSTGNPWDIITPITPLFQLHKRSESREEFHEEFRGKREFDHLKGFWGWKESIL